MKPTKWILVAILPAILGMGFVGQFVCAPSRVSIFASSCILVLLCLIAVIIFLFTEKRAYPIGLALIIFISAYLTTNTLFLNQEIPHEVPEIIRTPTDPGLGHTAVIYFTHGEPEEFSVNAWIETMRHLDEDKVPFIPKPFRPLFFRGIRSEYIEAGKSIHNQEHGRMLASLSEIMLDQDDSDLKFYPSFLDTAPRPNAAVIQALNEGASKIILMPVFLTISSHTSEGIELVEEVELGDFGVPLCIADPLWDSEQLKLMFVSRVNQNRGLIPKSDVGIMLIGHGQPEEWDSIYPTQTEQENLFRESVRQMLVADGYAPENITLSWMEFKSPNIVESAKQIYQQNISILMVFPASISADSIHTDIEIPAAIEESTVPDEVEILFMGAWNNDPLVIEGIRQNILACLP